VVASILELLFALLALGLAGHILIRLAERQRQAGRKDD
jgi:hypothetical protein